MKLLFPDVREIERLELLTVLANEPRPPSALVAPVEDLPWYLWRVDKKNNVVKR